IEDVYSYADLQISLEYIYSQGAFVGGLTAQNNDGATVTGSLFAGQLDVAQPVDALGGICGENNGVIENVYNAGKIVSGDTVGLTYIGGINGINRNTLKYAINSAPIYGVTKGGITALRVGNTVQFSYYDSDLSLVSKAIYGINDTNQFMGLTSQELSDSTIEALDFPTAKWGKYSDEFDGARYFAPYLTTIEELNPVYSKDAATLRVYEFDRTKRFDTENLYGTEANPYILSTATHFDTLAELVNSSYSYENKYFVAQGDQDGILDLTGFNKTVGTRGLTGGDRPFEGSFDGKYVTVTNFVIDRSSATSETLKRYIGLFGFVSSEGHVFNFKLDNTCSVVAKEYSGGVVGYNMGRVENIESQAAVRGDSFIGGVIGYNGNSGILNDILCVGEVLGNVGASHIYGVVGDGYFQNSSNVWYAVSSSSASINTQNRGRTLIIDIENAVRNKDPLTGEISFGQTDDYGAHSIKVTKDSNGRIAFNGQASTPWAIEYRFADETIVSASADYEPPAVAGGEIRPVYARLVRTITAQVSGYESRLYFNKTLEGSTTTYQINDKFYRGQEVTMYSEVPEGSYLPRASALVQDPFTYSVIEDPTFVFSYSTLQNDPRVVVHFNMIASLYMVAPQFDAINAPAVLPKTYDGTGNLFMGGGEPYSVSVDGFSVDYSYNVAGGAPRNVGHYAITINVRSLDGIRRGSQTVEYDISPRSITLSTDMLTRQKEYDGEIGPVPAPVINQSGITDIITGDALEIKSDASYATTDIGWTTANFTFTINGAAANNYVAPPSMLNVPCEITKRALIIEIDTQHLSYVYDGLAAQIPYFGYQKAPLAWLVPVADIYMSKDIVHTEMDAIDVDTYDVNVRLNDDPQFNYEGKPITYYYSVEFADTYTFTITPRPVDITFADYEGLVYNGVAQSIKAYFDDIEGVRQEVPSACIAYEMLEGSGNFDEPDKLKHAGSYSVTVTLPLEGNYVATLSTNTFAVTLAKAYQPAITIAPLSGPFVYGDAPLTLALDGAAADSTGAVTYTVLSGKAEISGDTIEFTGGGDVFVSAYKEADFNYYSATTPNYKITVNKAEILIDLVDIVKIYGDTTDQLVYVFDGYAARDNGKSVPDGFVPPSVIITGESVDEPLNQYKKYNAGIYTLHIQQDAVSDGYTFDYSLFDPMPSLTIQQKAVILRPDNKEQTYGRADALGAPQDLPLTYTLYSGDETLIVALSDITLTREDGVSVRTGDQYYTIECDNEEAATVANPNYNITFETGKYYILPKTLTLTAISQSKNFGDADPIPLYSVSGLAPWDTAEQVVGVKNESLPVLTRQEGENAFYEFSNQYGVYYYSSSNVQLSPDYTLTFIHGTLTI
ncbi:MAG: MBG domain-containing protein, partial [Clostridia bacterium]|nr:MBG domain-containing protein [Clostridia bacterium]